MLNNIAHQKPITSNPGTIQATSITSKAFITKIKSPKVKMLIGKVKITRIGLITAFTIPSISATNNATTNVVTVTPGKKYAATKIINVIISQLIKIFININLY